VDLLLSPKTQPEEWSARSEVKGREENRTHPQPEVPITMMRAGRGVMMRGEMREDEGDREEEWTGTRAIAEGVGRLKESSGGEKSEQSEVKEGERGPKRVGRVDEIHFATFSSDCLSASCRD
jgi:hypothetical protein